jgi:hypothetical protein
MTIIADDTQPIVVNIIGPVKVLGFAPRTVRIEGNTDALSAIGHKQLTRAIEATLDALDADQRAQRWSKRAMQAWDRGETPPVYYAGEDL